jgi:hypothetical protein
VWTFEGKEKTVRIAQMPVGGTSPHGDGSIEWRVSTPKKILPDGWIMFDLPLRDQVNTHGRENFKRVKNRPRGSAAIEQRATLMVENKTPVKRRTLISSSLSRLIREGSSR